jgi:hypothetical protein
MKIYYKILLFSLVAFTSCSKKESVAEDVLVTNRDTLVDIPFQHLKKVMEFSE